MAAQLFVSPLSQQASRGTTQYAASSSFTVRAWGLGLIPMSAMPSEGTDNYSTAENDAVCKVPMSSDGKVHTNGPCRVRIPEHVVPPLFLFEWSRATVQRPAFTRGLPLEVTGDAENFGINTTSSGHFIETPSATTPQPDSARTPGQKITFSP